jgi:hypothetical protein
MIKEIQAPKTIVNVSDYSLPTLANFFSHASFSTISGGKITTKDMNRRVIGPILCDDSIERIEEYRQKGKPNASICLTSFFDGEKREILPGVCEQCKEICVSFAVLEEDGKRILSFKFAAV